MKTYTLRQLRGAFAAGARTGANINVDLYEQINYSRLRANEFLERGDLLMALRWSELMGKQCELYLNKAE